ncbi:MAG: tetratricopeptide repeat protein [Cyanobacteria bacterium J06621_11]
MRTLEPDSFNACHFFQAETVKKKTHITREKNKLKASSLSRFRTDSWLSDADANFLLRKRAQREASKKNYLTAIALFSRLTAYEPHNAENFANRGLMHYNLRQYPQALKDYNRAIELDPELGRAYSNRANLHASQRNWTDAIADYDQAIDLNPLNIRARLNQSITFREMRDYEAALDCLDIALFFRPNSPALHAERGRTYQLKGEWNKAMSDYATARNLIQATAPAELNNSKPNELARINSRVLRWMHNL